MTTLTLPDISVVDAEGETIQPDDNPNHQSEVTENYTPSEFDPDAFDPDADQAEFHDQKKWRKLSGIQKDRTLTKYACKTLSRLKAEGQLVRLNGSIVLVTKAARWVIERNSTKLNDALYRATKITTSHYWARHIIDRVLIEAERIAEGIQFGRYMIINDDRIIVSAANGIFQVDRLGVSVIKDPQKFFFEPRGKPWTHLPLTAAERFQSAQMFKRLLADSQAIDPRSRMSLAIAQAMLPFIRSWMPTRPIFPGISKEGGEGKTFGKDRFNYLLYGESGAETRTAAAARRVVDPLTLYDDQDNLPEWLMLHMKRGATGTHHSAMKRDALGGWELDQSSEGDTINMFTATRLPKDSPFLSRFWPSSYSKEWFSPEFRSEGKTREEILAHRDQMLSLILDVLSEAMREDAIPDLESYCNLPYPRTYEAFQWLLRLLRAFERVAPGLIDPEKEFAGFLEVLRGEETETKDLTSDELTLLDQIFERMESEEDGSGVFAEDGLLWDGKTMIGSTSSWSKVLNKLAKEQNLRLRYTNAGNIGRWLAGDVNSSVGFSAEQISIGSGIAKRRAWRVSRRPVGQHGVTLGN